MTNVCAVDVFCGVGGLTRGLMDAGIEVVAGIDLDDSCEHAYTANNSSWFVPVDVSDVKGSDLAQLFQSDALTMLAGCAPCQPFSQLSKKIEKNDPTSYKVDKRHSLLGEFGRLVEESRPDIVTMENVPNVMSRPVFAEFLETLRRLEYRVNYQVVNCVDYLVPQSRRRLVLLAALSYDIHLPTPPNRRRTLREAISHLPALKSGEGSSTDPLHKARTLSALNLKRIRQSRPGGTWSDWDLDIRSPCHNVATGSSFRAVYGRMKYDEPASTITTQFYNFGTGRFGHPVQDRAITLREAAILQTFPDDYEFVPQGEIAHFETIGRHIGNAVPPALGRVIGKAVLDAVNHGG